MISIVYPRPSRRAFRNKASFLTPRMFCYQGTCAHVFSAALENPLNHLSLGAPWADRPSMWPDAIILGARLEPKPYSKLLRCGESRELRYVRMASLLCLSGCCESGDIHCDRYASYIDLASTCAQRIVLLLARLSRSARPPRSPQIARYRRHSRPKIYTFFKL